MSNPSVVSSLNIDIAEISAGSIQDAGMPEQVEYPEILKIRKLKLINSAKSGSEIASNAGAALASTGSGITPEADEAEQLLANPYIVRIPKKFRNRN